MDLQAAAPTGRRRFLFLVEITVDQQERLVVGRAPHRVQQERRAVLQLVTQESLTVQLLIQVSYRSSQLFLQAL